MADLTHWGNFYVILGGAAAALTGLQFVVMVLGSEMNRGTEETTRAFGTPTIVHFGTVLLVAGIMTAPWPFAWPAALLLGLCGLAGLGYTASIIWLAVRQTFYRPVLEDWLWHFTLPPLSYLALVVASLVEPGRPAVALFTVAGATLFLLIVGVHNAWDSVTFLALQRRPEPKPAPAAPQADSGAPVRVTGGGSWVISSAERFEESVAFFRDVLGLPVAAEGVPVADTQFARYAQLALPGGGVIEVVEPTPEARGRYAGPVVSITVDDLARARAELERREVPFLTATVLAGDGWGWAYFRAPDGHVYQIQGPCGG